jgi:hypothetical protein
MNLPTPHLEKLTAVLANDKLPPAVKGIIQEAMNRYQAWIAAMRTVTDTNLEEIVSRMVALLNDYKLFVDVDVIFDREDDFLYRQKGQTKLDNSIVEEFLPHLVLKCLLQGKSNADFSVGPTTAFSAIYFASSLDAPAAGGGLTVRTKDQDFAIAKRVYMKASHDPEYRESASKIVDIAYVVAECKTNLDKTMFQEAVATAHDVKAAVTGAKYYLLCEWLDMTPQSTAATDIDEVIILRKAKRLSSNVRGAFGKYAGRQSGRAGFVKFLQDHSLRPEMFLRFIDHIARLMQSEEPDEKDVLENGFF